MQTRTLSYCKSVIAHRLRWRVGGSTLTEGAVSGRGWALIQRLLHRAFPLLYCNRVLILIFHIGNIIVLSKSIKIHLRNSVNRDYVLKSPVFILHTNFSPKALKNCMIYHRYICFAFFSCGSIIYFMLRTTDAIVLSMFSLKFW